MKKPNFENKKIRAWKYNPKTSPPDSETFSADLTKEKIYETRVYALSSGILVKVIAKQNLKSGWIEALFFSTVGKTKRNEMTKTFQDENGYSKYLKTFEFELGTRFGVKPSAVSIVSKEEFEKIFKKFEKESCQKTKTHSLKSKKKSNG